MRLIDADKVLVDMWNALYAYEDRLEETHGLDVIERLNVQNGFEVGQQIVVNAPTIEPNPRWIPIKYRPMDEEEKQYWSEYMDEDDEMEMFDCPMPEDGQEILVTFKSSYVSMDICEIDGGLYGLDENGDWDGVTAWLPLPEPYREVEV